MLYLCQHCHSNHYITDECPVGSYLTNDSCVACPIGRYTDQPGQLSCLHCPDGQTTNLEGATGISQCVGMYVILHNDLASHDLT